MKFYFLPLVAAGAQAVGAIGSLIPKKKSFLDTSAVQQQLQAKQLASQEAQSAAGRQQQAAQAQITVEERAAAQRAAAFDRIIGSFQRGLTL